MENTAIKSLAVKNLQDYSLAKTTAVDVQDLAKPFKAL